MFKGLLTFLSLRLISPSSQFLKNQVNDAYFSFLIFSSLFHLPSTHHLTRTVYSVNRAWPSVHLCPSHPDYFLTENSLHSPPSQLRPLSLDTYCRASYLSSAHSVCLHLVFSVSLSFMSLHWGYIHGWGAHIPDSSWKSMSVRLCLLRMTRIGLTYPHLCIWLSTQSMSKCDIVHREASWSTMAQTLAFSLIRPSLAQKAIRHKLKGKKLKSIIWALVCKAYSLQHQYIDATTARLAPAVTMVTSWDASWMHAHLASICNEGSLALQSLTKKGKVNNTLCCRRCEVDGSPRLSFLVPVCLQWTQLKLIQTQRHRDDVISCTLSHPHQ